MERRLILESCLQTHEWGLFDMYMLLCEDIVEFVVPDRMKLLVSTYVDHVDLYRKEKEWEHRDIKFPYEYRNNPHLLLTILTVRCPVSNSG